MAFPVGPTNGQITTVNGIKYVYRSATNSWARLGSAKFTAAASAPSNAAQGDRWYNTGLDILFEYINDGTSNYWVDIQSVGQTGNVISIGDSVLNGNVVVGVDTRYSIGANTGYVKNIYANTTVSNSFITTNGVFWSSNGISVTGTPYTVSSTPPSSPNLGEQWYNTSNDVLYEYISDGTSSYWVDIQSTVLSSNTNIITTANEFYSYANTKIGTNTNGNLVVVANTDSASNTTGALVVGGGVGITGNINLVYNPTSGTGYALGLTGKDTQGGTGYFDFMKITNTTAGVTNGAKSFRLTSVGGIEIINNAYTSALLVLSDAGDLNIKNSISVNGSQAVNGPAFSAYANATLQTITSGSQQKVLFQTEEFDTNNNYTNSTFTPTVAGYYQLNAEVRLDGASGTGEMMIILYKNGSEYKRGTNQSGTQIATNFWAMQVSSIAYANGTGDYFEIYVQQGSGSSVTVTAVNNQAITWFNGCMIRGA